MSKAAITRLFAASCVALAAGVVMAIAALITAIANGAVEFGGVDPVAVDGGALAGMVAWLAVASVLAGIGGLSALASWIGALWNTIQLEDKTWFVALLALGLISFGWLAMLAYVFAGPDATQHPQSPGRASPATGR